MYSGESMPAEANGEERELIQTADRAGCEEQPLEAAPDTPVSSKQVKQSAKVKSKAGRPPTATRWESLKERSNSWSGTEKDIREFLRRGSGEEGEATNREGKRKERDSPGEGPIKESKIAFICMGKESPWFRKSTTTARSPTEKVMGDNPGGGEEKNEAKGGENGGSNVEQLLQLLLARQDETTTAIKQMKEEASKTREADRRVAVEGRKELKQEISGLADSLTRTCETWAKEKAQLEERIRTLEKDREDWIEKETRARKEWEKKVEDRLEDRQTKEKEGPERREGRDKVGEIEEKLIWMERESERQEREKRRRNVIVRGKEIQEAENKEDAACKAINSAAGEEVDVEECRVMNNARGSRVLIKIRSWTEKRKVMQGKRSLGRRKVYIDDDLTVKERAIQKAMVEKARDLERLGYKTNVSYRKLWVNSVGYAWSEEAGTAGACFDREIAAAAAEERGTGNGRGQRENGSREEVE